MRDCNCWILIASFVLSYATGVACADHDNPFGLQLPDHPVPDRMSLKRFIGANERRNWAELEGPGCIKHIWITLNHPLKTVHTNRKMIIRIYFDGSETPHVEAPIGDFFGVMHGVDAYPINTPFLSVKEYSGYNCYFDMPFAKSARIELETGGEANVCYMQVSWHRYPGQELKESRRFCANWRKENPTESYGDGFLLLDADGPGDLIGFVYGLRLIDNVDRWSHGGAENIYIDGEGEHPAFIRGIGGEDTFGTSYGGAHHPPETHLHAGIPYYEHEDIGEARRAQRLVGYRFFTQDTIPFRKSIHMRFGTMQNNICSTVYWYQSGSPRPYVKMPKWAGLSPDTALPRGEMDLPLPDSGHWWISKFEDNRENVAIKNAANAAASFPASLEENMTKWPSRHGFVDFNHVARPEVRGVGTFYEGKVAQARCVLNASKATKARLHLTWDDHLVLRVNDAKPLDLGHHRAFRSDTVEVDLLPGENLITVSLSNTTGSNHGGWAFAFNATTAEGKELQPQAP